MFDATHLQNIQPTATVNVAEKSNSRASIIRESSDLKSLNIQTHDALEVLWNLDFGTRNFPTNRKFREAGLRA
jgi:hypothetical protein